MTGRTCMQCGKPLQSDEIALHRRLFGRGVTAYRCLDCQAAYLNTTRARLEAVIARYHETGICALFAKWDAKGGS